MAHRKTPYHIQIVNSLLDNVHGFIGLTPVENSIEKLPVFKRLQGISQLGLANRIFPCALHNRYTHSLGVMHIVDQMAVRLKFDEDERQVIRLAALLHDIGHYPFSHDVESAYLQAAKVTSSPSDEELWRYAESTHKKVRDIAGVSAQIDYFASGTSNPQHHEMVGARIIRSSKKLKAAILELYIEKSPLYSGAPNALDSVVEDICAIIIGDAQHRSQFFHDKFSAMVQIMHSELDADRIDYLLRDATFSGASYGSFDTGMLIQNLVMARESPKGPYIVGVNRKGIGCAEQLLLNRYFAYSQVIFHKYTSILGCALQSVVQWLIQDRSAAFWYADIVGMADKHESDERFLSYTDATLISKISEIKKPCPDDIYRLAQFIKDYQSLPLVDENVCSGCRADELSRLLERSPIYREVDAVITGAPSLPLKRAYQYREIRLSKHVPLQAFQDQLDQAIAGGVIEADMRDSFLTDRLEDGIAVIEEGKKPYLLVDSERSLLREMYGLRYCILRSYQVYEEPLPPPPKAKSRSKVR